MYQSNLYKFSHVSLFLPVINFYINIFNIDPAFYEEDLVAQVVMSVAIFMSRYGQNYSLHISLFTFCVKVQKMKWHFCVSHQDLVTNYLILIVLFYI